MEKLLKTRHSVVVAVIHDLLNGEWFAAIPDLKEAVKCRCAQLKIPYDAGRIAAALDVVARTRPLLHARCPGAPADRALRRRVGPSGGDIGPFSRQDAADIFARIYRHLGLR